MSFLLLAQEVFALRGPERSPRSGPFAIWNSFFLGSIIDPEIRQKIVRHFVFSTFIICGAVVDADPPVLAA